ncbi:MAG: hypothetical protein COB81_03045 [Flavobacteriaceae bacterium]|nr:MAG: hypothetical protein COB81_03045 [Flavobacteriaceae bacterium]
MKNLKLIGFSVLILCMISCNKNEEIIQGEFEFITQYSATITIGGVVGIMERTFETGEIYSGKDNGEKTITIRIAEHTERNDDCPNSWCYQEFLEVPREFLKLEE